MYNKNSLSLLKAMRPLIQAMGTLDFSRPFSTFEVTYNIVGDLEFAVHLSYDPYSLYPDPTIYNGIHIAVAVNDFELCQLFISDAVVFDDEEYISISPFGVRYDTNGKYTVRIYDSDDHFTLSLPVTEEQYFMKSTLHEMKHSYEFIEEVSKMTFHPHIKVVLIESSRYNEATPEQYPAMERIMEMNCTKIINQIKAGGDE